MTSQGEGIASIAADTLRINGALRQFKQVSWFKGIFKYFWTNQVPTKYGKVHLVAFQYPAFGLQNHLAMCILALLAVIISI